MPIESSQHAATFTGSQDRPDTLVRRNCEIGHPVELAAHFFRADEAELRAVLLVVVRFPVVVLPSVSIQTNQTIPFSSDPEIAVTVFENLP